MPRLVMMRGLRSCVPWPGVARRSVSQAPVRGIRGPRRTEAARDLLRSLPEAVGFWDNSLGVHAPLALLRNMSGNFARATSPDFGAN